MNGELIDVRLFGIIYCITVRLLMYGVVHELESQSLKVSVELLLSFSVLIWGCWCLTDCEVEYDTERLHIGVDTARKDLHEGSKGIRLCGDDRGGGVHGNGRECELWRVHGGSGGRDLDIPAADCKAEPFLLGVFAD